MRRILNTCGNKIILKLQNAYVGKWLRCGAALLQYVCGGRGSLLKCLAVKPLQVTLRSYWQPLRQAK